MRLPCATSSVNNKGETEYARVFRVVTSSPTIGNLAVRTAGGIPRVGDAYVTPTEFDLNSLCQRVAPQQDGDNPRVWEVRVEYAPPEGDEEQQNPNPLLRPAIITWGFSKNTRAVWKDIDGKGVVNSAGEYFDPPPEIDDSRPVLTITRNEPSFNPGIAVQYQDAINSDGFFGASAGQAKVAGISASSQTENNFFFWSVTYEFEFRREGWKLEILDQGMNYKGPDGKLRPLHQRNEDGDIIKNLPISSPVPLNGLGLGLDVPTPASVNFRPFNVYKSMPFSALGVP